jgi:hypothetical protein
VEVLEQEEQGDARRTGQVEGGFELLTAGKRRKLVQSITSLMVAGRQMMVAGGTHIKEQME